MSGFRALWNSVQFSHLASVDPARTAAAGRSPAARRLGRLQPLPGWSPGATTRRRSWPAGPASSPSPSGPAHPRPTPRPRSQVRPRDLSCFGRLRMPAMAAELLAAVHLPPVPDLPAPLPPRPTAVPRASHVPCAQVTRASARRPTLRPMPATSLSIAGRGAAGGPPPRPPTRRRRAAAATLPHPPPAPPLRCPRPPPTTARAARITTTARAACTRIAARAAAWAAAWRALRRRSTGSSGAPPRRPKILRAVRDHRRPSRRKSIRPPSWSASAHADYLLVVLLNETHEPR